MKKLFCFPALELFRCLPLWETEFFHRGRQLKSSRAEIVHLVTAYFKGFQLKVFDFLLKIVRVTLGGKNHYYTTKIKQQV